MRKRFEIWVNDNISIFDTDTGKYHGMNTALDLLNEQDEKIKSYEKLMNKYNVEVLEHLDLMLLCLSGETKYRLAEIKENQQLKIRLDKTISDCNNLFVENQQLQSSQNQKAIEVLEKLKEYCEERKQSIYYFNYVLTDETAGIKGIPTLYEYIDSQIAELQQQLAERDKEIEWLKHKLDVEYPCIIMNYRDMLKSLKIRLYTQPREIVEKIKQKLRERVTEMNDTEHCYLQKAVRWHDIVPILGQILKEYEKKADMVEVCDD